MRWAAAPRHGSTSCGAPADRVHQWRSNLSAPISSRCTASRPGMAACSTLARTGKPMRCRWSSIPWRRGPWALPTRAMPSARCCSSLPGTASWSRSGSSVTPRATVYTLSKAEPTVTVRALPGTSLAQLEQGVVALWPRYFPHALPKTRPAGAVLADGYADDARLARLLAAATLVALGIATFGTYALAAHTVQRRAGGIVLRKLHGARRPDIALLVARDIGTLLLAAGAIAMPLAVLAMERYLSGFVERAPMGWWPPVLALGGTLLVAALAAARHAWLAMGLMPAQALRA